MKMTTEDAAKELRERQLALMQKRTELRRELRSCLRQLDANRLAIMALTAFPTDEAKKQT